MFGLFAPKCPVSTLEKTWTETRLRWLADRLGMDRLVKAQVLLLTEGSFPFPFDGCAEDALRVMEWLGDSMGVERGRLRLEVCPDETLPGAAGHYDTAWPRAVIRVAESQLADPERLAATLAHELGHELLLGGGLLTADVPDHEPITDLLLVFLGAGVVAANATLREASGHTLGMSWWQIGRQGYLPSRVIGYALALFAFLRGEDRPAWAEHLRPDAAEPFWKGLRYLGRTTDSVFHPEAVASLGRTRSADEVASLLRRGTPSARLGLLWELHERPVPTPEVVAAVQAALSDRDPDLPGEAARTLAAFGAAAADAVPALVGVLDAGEEATRAGAAYALGRLRLRPDLAVPGLAELLGQKNRRVRAQTAAALSQFGRAAEPAAGPLVAALADVLKDCDQPLIDLLGAAVVAVAPDPARVVREYFEDRDKELRRQALRAVKEAAARSLPADPHPEQGRPE